MIRQILLVFILMQLPFVLQAQKINFTDTTNEWYVSKNKTITPAGFMIYTFTMSHYYYSGVKTINNKDYLIVRNDQKSVQYETKYNHNTRSYDTVNINKTNGDNILCFVRKDATSSRIYKAYSDTSSSEYILYDDSMTVGDTILPYSTYDRFFVDSKDSVMINSVYHSVYKMKPTNMYSSYGLYTTVEGIGSLVDPFGPGIVSTSYHVYDRSSVICFKNRYGYIQTNGIPQISCVDTNLSVNTLEPNQSDAQVMTIYPQPASDYLNIELSHNVSGMFYLYNSLGQLVIMQRIEQSRSIHFKNEQHLNGMYSYRIFAEGKSVLSGKVIFR